MKVLVKLTLPNYIYRFYRDASVHVDTATPEQVMADALSAYAGLLSQDIARLRQAEASQSQPEALGNSSTSRSR